MLRRTNGYFLLELLLSLSALLEICLFLIPLLLDMRDQSRQLHRISIAQQLMYEELQSKTITPANFSEYGFTDNGETYQIVWQDTQPTGPKEVCVFVKQNQNLSDTKVCGRLE